MGGVMIYKKITQEELNSLQRNEKGELELRDYDLSEVCLPFDEEVILICNCIVNLFFNINTKEKPKKFGRDYKTKYYNK